MLGFDDRGKVKLSMREVDQETGEDITEKVGAKPGRGDRRERDHSRPAEQSAGAASRPAASESGGCERRMGLKILRSRANGGRSSWTARGQGEEIGP